MRKTNKILVYFLIFFTSVYSSPRIEDIKYKNIKNNLVYFKNEATPYSGKLVDSDSIYNYKNGIKNGYFRGITPLDNSFVEYRGSFFNGLPHGVWNFKYFNGNNKASLKFKYGEPHGRWLYFYEDGSLQGFINIKNGLLEGPSEYYCEHGYMIAKVNYSNGLLNGKASFFYCENTPKVFAYFNKGLLNGSINIFSGKGKHFLRGEYDNNRRVDNWKFYYISGELKANVIYVDGNRHGLTTIYDKGGSIIDKFLFKNGDEVNKKGIVLNPNTELSDDIIAFFENFNNNKEQFKYINFLNNLE